MNREFMEVSALFVEVESKRIMMRMCDFPFLLELVLLGAEVSTKEGFKTAMRAIKLPTIRSRKGISDKDRELEEARELVEKIQHDVIMSFDHDLEIIAGTRSNFSDFCDDESGSERPGMYEPISPGPFEPTSPEPYEPISPGLFEPTSPEPCESTFQGNYEPSSPVPYVYHQYYDTDGQSYDTDSTYEGPIYTKKVVLIRCKDFCYFNDQGQ